MEIVFDSSTLILLAKIEILRDVSEDIQIIIPERVKRECTLKDVYDAKLISTLIKESNIKVFKIGKKRVVNKLCKDFKIHKGEAEALCLAMERECPLAADDLLTIKACKILNRSFATAIHLLINIMEQGRIDRQVAMLKLDKLSLYGRYKRQILEDAKKRLKGGA